MLPHMDVLKPYGQYWFVTITPYGKDIGAYDSCGHFCKYCYANTNAALVKENMKKHDPKSPFLIGNSQPEDVLHEAEQKSWVDHQMRLAL